MSQRVFSICVVPSLYRDNNVRVTYSSTVHHEAAAHVLAGEPAVELSSSECICSDVIRVELARRCGPLLTARLSPHEGTKPKSQLGGLLSLQRVTSALPLFSPFPTAATLQ